MSNFHPFAVMGRGSETQLQVCENLNKVTNKRHWLHSSGSRVSTRPTGQRADISSGDRAQSGNTRHYPNVGSMLGHRL